MSKVVGCERCFKYFKTSSNSTTKCPYCGKIINFKTKFPIKVFYNNKNENQTTEAVKQLNYKPKR